jgi:hypothetical protein
MRYTDKWFFYALIGATSLLFGAMMVASAQPASAQCGTSASSCKSCHETQGQMSVANNGDWHKAHAFGDFCEFCHAGNVQSTAKAEAHTGMVEPLGDVKASCQGCHPTDFTNRAEQYATVLGVKLDTGGGAGNPGSGGDSSANNPNGGATAVGTTSVGAPLGGEEIDFNLLYAEATAQPPLVSNWGNVILILLILSTGLAFVGTAWSWEGWGQKVAGWIDRNVSPIPQAVAAAAARSDGSAAMSQALAANNSAQVRVLLAQKPELRDLLPKLMNLPPETLSALNSLLANPERGNNLLQTLSHVDAEVLAALRQLGAKDRGLLMTLLKE